MDQATHHSRRKFTGANLDDQALYSLKWESTFAALSSTLTNGDSSRFFAAMDVYQDPIDRILEEFPTFGLVANKGASAEDNPNWGEAMHGPHSDGFLKASTVEIRERVRLCHRCGHGLGGHQ